MANPALDVLDDLPGRALVPESIEGFGGDPELDDEVIRVVWWLRLGALLSPQAGKGGLVRAHDDAGVRATHKRAALRGSPSDLCRLNCTFRHEYSYGFPSRETSLSMCILGL